MHFTRVALFALLVLGLALAGKVTQNTYSSTDCSGKPTSSVSYNTGCVSSGGNSASYTVENNQVTVWYVSLLFHLPNSWATFTFIFLLTHTLIFYLYSSFVGNSKCQSGTGTCVSAVAVNQCLNLTLAGSVEWVYKGSASSIALPIVAIFGAVAALLL